MTSLEQLEQVVDKKDRILSRIYMLKLEILTEDESNLLQRCFYCNNLFTMDQQEHLICTKAYKKKIFIDYKGSVIVKHVVDRAFDVKKFYLYLKKQKNMGWKEIYFKIYSFT